MSFPTQVVPFPTDPYEQMHYNMVRAHATFKLGLDNILQRLDNPPTADLANFLGYCEGWAASIDHHHSTEEAILFPFLDQKLDFSHELAQHKTIHTCLDEVMDYIRAAKSDLHKFDPIKAKQLVQNLRDPLYQHLDDEVKHIVPENLKVFDVEALTELNAKIEHHAKSNGDPFLVVPFMYSHTPQEYKGIWPPLPWILRKVVIPYVLAARHYGYWKYSPYSTS